MKPNIYLIADRSNEELAHELLQGNKYYISKMKSLLFRKEEYSGLLFIIIDDTPSQDLLVEIQQAVEIYNSSKQYSIFPVILNDAAVPLSLVKLDCIRLNTKSPDDKREVQQKVQAQIQGNYEAVKRKIVTNINRKISGSLSIASLLVCVIATIISILSLEVQESLFLEVESKNYILTLVIIVITIVVALVYTIGLDSKKKRQVEKEKYEYKKEIFDIFAVGKDRGDIDFSKLTLQIEEDPLKMMIVNLFGIKDFYGWSQRQAKGAFTLAIIMCAVGTIIIVLAAIGVLWFDKAISSSIIAGIGGAIVELIAGTALVIYKNSLSQFNYYHKALHEDQRFLSSIAITSKLSNEEAKDEVIKEVVKDMMQMNLNAVKQEHLDVK